MRETLPSKLDLLKKEHFAPETKDVRVAKALAALDAPPTLLLNADQWKDAAENSELEEEQ